MAKQCIPCNRSNVSELHTFCSSCGKALTSEQKCECCNYVLSSFEKFCPKCGTSNPEYKS